MKKDTISEAPPILVIHFRRLDRSTGVIKKVERHVAFKDMLDIRPFMVMEKRYLPFTAVFLLTYCK